MTMNEHFEHFWNAYPRKVGKQKAREKYKLALKRIGAEGKGGVLFLLGRVQLFAECIDKWPEFDKRGDRIKPDMIPHPATWLHQGRYDDDPNEWERYSNTKSAQIQRDTDWQMKKQQEYELKGREDACTPEESKEMWSQWRQRHEREAKP